MHPTFKFIVENLLCILAWTVFIPIFCIPFATFVMLKFCVILVAKWKGLKIYPFMRMDTYFQCQDFWKNPQANIGRIIRVNGSISVTDFRKKFESCFLKEVNSKGEPKYDGFYKLPCEYMGYLFYSLVDNIDLNEKILQGHEVKNETEIFNIANKWRTEPFKVNTPLWEIVLYPMKNETWILFRINHIIADGYTMLHIMDQVTNTKSPYLVKDFKESLIEKEELFWRGPLLLSKLFITKIWKQKYFSKGKRIVNGPQSTVFNLWTTFDLDKILEIRKNTNVHFAPLIGTLLGAGLKRFISENEAEEDLPDDILTCCPLPWPDRPKKLMCNNMSFGHFVQPFKSDSSLHRLLQFENDFNHHQESGTDKIYGRFFLHLLQYLPIKIFPRVLSLSFGSVVVFSAILGNKEQNHSILGLPISNAFSMLGIPEPNGAIFMTCISQNKQIDACLAFNKDIFPNNESAERYISYLRKEIDLLLEESRKKTS